MKYENVELGGFPVIGISVRTSNKAGQTEINKLWERFMVEGLAMAIPNKAGGEIYCIYTDYESDFTGEYTTVLGCRVSTLDVIPEGFVGVEIPAGNYKHFVAHGPVPQSVGKVWGEIWQSGMPRGYKADFDVYGPSSQDPENPEVDIYLS